MAFTFLVRYAIDIEVLAEGMMATYPIGPKLRLGTLDFKDITTRFQVPLVGAGIAQPVGYVSVPGGATPTQNNFRTAIGGVTTTPPAGSMFADLDTAIGLDLTRIQGLATGGG